VEQTRNNVTNNHGNSDSSETAFARCLGKTFGITGPLSNMAFSASFFLFMCFMVFLAIWKTAGIDWTRYADAGCFFASLAVCALAFATQTVSQIIRMTERVRAGMKGEKPREFKERTPEFAKTIAKYFRAKSYPVHNAAIRVRTRNHARLHRRAARPAFAHASSSPVGGSSDDGSGDSDPPGHQSSVTPSYSPEQPNRAKEKRPRISPGWFSMPRRSQRRRFA
jgi:hypothetical protein